MSDTTLDLGWFRFSGQALVSFLAIIGGAVANRILHESGYDASSFALAANLVLIPLVAVMFLSRVPYRKDEFERRLRNWSMTQSAVWVLLGGVIARLLTELANPGSSPVTIYILPGAFFLTYAIYSQYLRFRIVTGGRNAFSDGTSCS